MQKKKISLELIKVNSNRRMTVKDNGKRYILIPSEDILMYFILGIIFLIIGGFIGIEEPAGAGSLGIGVGLVLMAAQEYSGGTID